jgi:hypothetical protein
MHSAGSRPAALYFAALPNHVRRGEPFVLVGKFSKNLRQNPGHLKSRRTGVTGNAHPRRRWGLLHHPGESCG